MLSSFSPVAGIQWVETLILGLTSITMLAVSVPLPGFSGLRPLLEIAYIRTQHCFSPVAGIQWVETRID